MDDHDMLGIWAIRLDADNFVITPDGQTWWRPTRALAEQAAGDWRTDFPDARPVCIVTTHEGPT